jgi:hypothetical protein
MHVHASLGSQHRQLVSKCCGLSVTSSSSKLWWNFPSELHLLFGQDQVEILTLCYGKCMQTGHGRCGFCLEI